MASGETTAVPGLRAERADLRSFWSLNATMFQGALSDNMFKFMLVMLVIAMAGDHARVAMEAAGAGMEGLAAAQTARAGAYQMWVNLAFTLPYILMATVAGWLADRFAKSRVTLWTKVLEVAIMALATAVFIFGPGLFGENSAWVLVGVLFLMGAQSALFSPSKYGIMPEILPERRIAWGNGLLQGFTFLAIILGTIAGPALFEFFREALWIPGLILIGLACVGCVTASLIRPTPVCQPGARLAVNPFPEPIRNLRLILADTGLTWGVAGLVVWWSVAVMLQGGAVIVATSILGLSPAQAGIALLPIVVGMGLGCALTSFLSRNRIELGLVPLGAVLMFAAGSIVYAMTPSTTELDALRAAGEAMPSIYLYGLPLAMGLVGMCSGMFIVPLESYVVNRADPANRGGIIATGNLLEAVGMMAGAVLLGVIVNKTGSTAWVFMASGIIMLVTGAIIFWRFPQIPIRLMVLVILRTRYRTRVRGLENIPATGGALITPNHQSFLDGLLLAAVIERPVRFVMSQMMYRKWFIYPFAKATNSIPIEADQSPRELIEALRKASEAIKSGELVCMFPEGQLTRNGVTMPFRRGLERVMKDLTQPIIPAAIDGAFESPWGIRMGRARWSGILRWGRLPMNVAFGAPLPPDTTLHAIRQQVEELLVDAFAERKADAEPLHRIGVATLRANPFARRYADHTTEREIPNAKVLATTVALAEKLRPHWQGQEFIGIVLPPGIGPMAINLGALLAGHIPVNLNYTASKQILAGICDGTKIRTIVTSRAFLEKAKVELPDGIAVVYTEDIAATITSGDRIRALLKGLLMPVAALERSLGRTKAATMDDLVTLIFSSGSTGIPKGVMLSHWNIWSNARAALHIIEIEPNDRFVGVLPFFHSFGFMATIWVPLIARAGVVFYPSPLDAKAIGAMVSKFRATVMFSTPTFLSGYTRRVEPGQFGSIRIVITGAEKLREGVADAFHRQFGIVAREGFGCTETSPVTAMSTLDYREPGIFQVGSKRGSVGHPVPGVAVRIVNLDTGAMQPPGETGMLLVRGGNIMQGYYGDPAKTADAMVDGVWYRTGDIAKRDEDGFLYITDRLSRFSKIGGEMVPHIRIEDALQKLAAIDEQVFAVTGIPDDKKGERLAVLYTIPEDKAKAAADGLSSPELSLPSLWIPKWPDFIKVDAIPTLGSGKMDLRAIKETAAGKLGGGGE